MKNNKAFTLIEMLIVMSIILMLMLLIIPNAIHKQQTVENQACTAQVKMIESQVMLYELEFNRRVTHLDQLVEAGYLTQEHLSCKSGAPITINDGYLRIEQ